MAEKAFAFSIAFIEAVAGVAYLTGNTKEAAMSKCNEMFKHHKDFRIVDVTELGEVEDIQQFNLPLNNPLRPEDLN